MRRLVVLSASACLAVLLACGAALAYPGDFDPTFGDSGTVRTTFSPPDDPRSSYAQDLAIQGDGKIVAVGYAQPDEFGQNGGYASARYNEDGSLDASYGNDGRVVTTVGQGAGGAANHVALGPNGTILAAGNSALVRYDSDGALDDSFGHAGVVSDPNLRGLKDVYAQDDGGTLVAAPYDSGDNVTRLYRYEANGSLDAAFGDDGSVALPFARTYLDEDQAEIIAVQAGKILIGGTVRNAGGNLDYGLARYEADGSLDETFGQDGQVRTYVSSSDDVVKSLAVTPDGKVLASGDSGLVRYNADGSVDDAFGEGGKQVDVSLGVSDMALQQDGGIYLAGTDYEDYATSLVRYTASGQLDTTFKTEDDAYNGPRLDVQGDGKPVVTRLRGNSGFLLQRYKGGEDSGPPDTTVTSGPPAYTSETDGYIRYSSSKARSTFECSIDDKPYSDCDYPRNNPRDYYSVNEGSHTFRVRATDDVGQVDPTPAVRNFFVDYSNPDGKISVNRGARTTASRKVTLYLTKTDDSPSSGVAQMRLMNGGKPWAPWQAYAPRKVWNLGPGGGSKSVRVQYKDRAGNTSYPASDSITYRP